MTEELAFSLAMAGGYAAVALAAVGSAMGSGIAGQAAIAAWKRCYAQNKPAPFLLVACTVLVEERMGEKVTLAASSAEKRIATTSPRSSAMPVTGVKTVADAG